MQSLLFKLPRRKLEPGLALWSFYVRSTVVMQKLRTCNCCIRCLFRTLESLSHRQNIFGSSFFWALFCRIIWFDLFITFYWKISSLTRKKKMEVHPESVILIHRMIFWSSFLEYISWRSLCLQFLSYSLRIPVSWNIASFRSL